MVKQWLLLAVVLLVVGMAAPVMAQSVQPTVQVALFYSPSCPHCHDVIDNHLPPIREQYGNSLEIFYINVQEQSGAMMMMDACRALNVPDANCGGVPAMVIGNQYLVGSVQIPTEMPGLIDAGLANGGVTVEHLPLLWGALEAQGYTTSSADAGTAATAPAAAATWQERFTADLGANVIAVIVLVASVLSLGSLLPIALRSSSGGVPAWLSGTGRGFGASVTIVGVLLAGSIAAEGAGVGLVLAVLTGLLLLGAVVMLARSGSNQAVPLLAVAGVIVSGYLAYVESGSAEAVCGLVGNCNAVQASPYAHTFGIANGIWGVIGYAVLLGVWTVSQRLDGAYGQLASLFVFVIAATGVAFSAYLTFLEPFVIGATCAWCLTSAVVMLAVLWLSAPTTLAAWQDSPNVSMRTA